MHKSRIFTVLTASVALSASPLWAVDTINVRSTGKPVQGEITTINKTEVTIKPHPVKRRKSPPTTSPASSGTASPRNS